MKLRDITLSFLLLAGTCCLLLFPEVCADAARQALALCVRVVIPSLFPFFVLSALLISCGAANAFGALLSAVMRPMFGLSGTGGSALALGLVGGYPVGARCVAALAAQGALSEEESALLLGFCNNAGPGFILGICGAAVFHSPRAGLYLYLVHVASALFTGMLLCRHRPRRGKSAAPARSVRRQGFAALLPEAVQGALSGILNVCAFVVLFMVLLRLLTLALPEFVRCSPLYPLLPGAVELTNGVTALPDSRLGFVLCAVFLGWGSLSVHAQTLAVLAVQPLSTRYYWRGKLLQAALSAPLAYLASFRVF